LGFPAPVDLGLLVGRVGPSSDEIRAVVTSLTGTA
jgi:hypothetical protein